MSTGFGSLGNVFLNLTLLIGGAFVLVLVYALVTRGFMPRTDPVREANPAGLVGEIIQVEVRNGCGTPGLAGEVTRFLRRQGFDVVESGNHTSYDVAASHVIDRVGDPASAQKVANALGIRPENIVEDINPEFYLDASVIIGHDYETLVPFRK